MTEERRILVVDDDDAVRGMVVSLLARRGLAAQGVGGAEAALEQLREHEFDVVLSDVRMPGRSGLELLAELRENHPQTPVVLMTGFGSIDSAVEAMREGATDYVTKPFRREDLLSAVERALDRRPEPTQAGDPVPSDDVLREMRDRESAAEARPPTLRELGDRYIEEVLKEAGGNKVRAARILGINRRTLYRRGDRARSQRGGSEQH